MNELIFPLIVFLFTLLFYLTSLQEKCWYRRFILPAMLVVLSVTALENTVIAVMFFVSAVLVYSGFRGYGKERLQKENEQEEIIEGKEGE